MRYSGYRFYIRRAISADEDVNTVSDNDTAQLLSKRPGYHVAAGGGVSGLPMVNAFADDRIKIRIDGLESISACANHMNAPLSYIDPKQIGKINLLAGITPVSVGGDSIGGTIEVQSAAPVFAEPGEGLHAEGSVSLSGRSINNGVSATVGATMANENLSLTYTGAHSRSCALSAHEQADLRAVARINHAYAQTALKPVMPALLLGKKVARHLRNVLKLLVKYTYLHRENQSKPRKSRPKPHKFMSQKPC